MAKREIVKLIIKNEKDKGMSVEMNTNGPLGEVLFGMINAVGKMFEGIPTELRNEAIEAFVADLNSKKVPTNDEK